MGDPMCQAAETPWAGLLSALGAGVWDWDIAGGTVWYSDAYLSMLGYSREEVSSSLEEWRAMRHPEDLPHAEALLAECLAGKIPAYCRESRMLRRDGGEVWTRDAGRIAARDAAGRPTRLLGGLLDISALRHSQRRLSEALEDLEHKHSSMESAAVRHTVEMAAQDKLLWTTSQISRRLLTIQPDGNFEGLIQDCLRLLGESIDTSRVYLCKDRCTPEGKLCCAQIYYWARGGPSARGAAYFKDIPYDGLPVFQSAMDGGRCLNSLLRDLSDSERTLMGPQGTKTILIAPIAINGKRWGFIGTDNCKSEQLFTIAEENLLMMSGSLLANAIEKMDYEAVLREMDERTQLMLNATPLCCNLWTPDLRNMSCNDEAVRLFDLSSQGEYLERFNELSPEYQPGGRRSSELAAGHISKAFQEGYCRFEWLHQKLDGTPVPAEIILVRIKYKDSYIVAGYTRDLREQKAMLAELKTRDALRRARDEALLNSKAKSNFLANMSHEIRTPMNAISGFAEIILRESTNEKTAEYAKGIKSACGSLINIINDILDISKIESGKLEITNASYDLGPLLQDVITISRMRLGAKPLMFLTDIDSRIPARLVGDEIRIKQILLNILSNAIKFTQEGFIALRVTGTTEGSRALLRFSVMDSGVGIRPEDLALLFEEFERVNTTKNRSIEGTGLGLAISKQLAEMMGGRIEVESTFGAGSKFTAILPQECPSYEPLARVARHKHVLLYEPRERYRRSIEETLQNLNCACASCANQSELYNKINEMPYDYILTPALHLKKVQATVRKNGLSVAVAAFTGHGETVSGGRVPAIPIPVSCLQLSALLNGQHEEDLSHNDDDGIHFVAPSARVLVVDDNPVNLQVAKGLMDPYQFTIDTAENGMEAVALVQANQYDLVFMDHMMPEMDGVDATVSIRALPGNYYQTLPIVALSANALVGTREMFIREGMNDFLAKPIEMNKLAHALYKWLPKSKLAKASPQPGGKRADGPPTWSIAGVNTTQGVLSVGGSGDNYLRILAAYHADGRQKCASLLQHFIHNDLAAFRIEVHALKSTSATIGALEVSQTAARLESAAQHGDTAFINHHIDTFLTELQAVLDAIHAVLPADAAQPDALRTQTAGRPEDLKAALDALQNAAELANIARLEADLHRLLACTWTAEITEALLSMEAHLGVFDYDALLERLLALRASL